MADPKLPVAGEEVSLVTSTATVAGGLRLRLRLGVRAGMGSMDKGSMGRQLSAYRDRHQCHGVISENINHLDRDHIPRRLCIQMLGALQV